MAAPVETGLTRADLDRFPDDGLRRELIDGVLYVSPKARTRHQRVMLWIGRLLLNYEEAHGGTVIIDTNDDFSDVTHLEPDAVYVLPEHQDRIGEMGVEGAPDLVVEISSPSTRHHDLIRKRAVYEREGVPEFWFVDLDVDRFEVYRLTGDGRYGPPLLVGRGETLTSPLLPGLALPIDDALGPPVPVTVG